RCWTAAVRTGERMRHDQFDFAAGARLAGLALMSAVAAAAIVIVFGQALRPGSAEARADIAAERSAFTRVALP
ncbi:MAG TPA: hypothetical protein VFF48_00235, partial [Brevundimonas sp.]|nr:hypothetical protein [Brevundimonas sp.]